MTKSHTVVALLSVFLVSLSASAINYPTYKPNRSVPNSNYRSQSVQQQQSAAAVQYGVVSSTPTQFGTTTTDGYTNAMSGPRKVNAGDWTAEGIPDGEITTADNGEILVASGGE